MLTERKEYYQQMLKKGRLMPLVVGDRFAGIITFYLTNDEHEYDNADPWGVFEDDASGSFCYISQMVTDRHKNNKRLSFRALGGFIAYIKDQFPQVKYIFWRRWNSKSKIVKVYKKEL